MNPKTGTDSASAGEYRGSHQTLKAELIPVVRVRSGEFMLLVPKLQGRKVDLIKSLVDRW